MNAPRRPRFPDIQQPPLYRAGVSLRRGYALGAAGSDEEAVLQELLAAPSAPVDAGDAPGTTILHLGPLATG